MFVDAAGEQVLHQAGLDALLLGNQRLGLFNGPVHRREDLGDFGLLKEFRYWKLKFLENILVKVPNRGASKIVVEKFTENIGLQYMIDIRVQVGAIFTPK